MKTFSTIKHNLRSPEELREDYVSGKLFALGDIVKTKSGQIGEIVSLGTNYVSLISEGKIVREWFQNVQKTLADVDSEVSFSSVPTDLFEAVVSVSDDKYAVFLCLESLESLFTANDVKESIPDFEVATRFIKKFNIVNESFQDIELLFLSEYITEGYRLDISNISENADNELNKVSDENVKILIENFLKYK